MGVKTVEAAQKVYGPYSIWSLYIGLALASYMYSLDGSTTSYYLTFATSEFSEHALISSVQVAQGIIVAVGKPVIAKVADVTSRATAYITVLVFYVVGYIIIASAQSVGSIAAGIIIYAVGYTGLQLLTQIIIADITSLKWRGLISSLTSSPFIVNAFVGANVAGAVLEKWGWRWGYGMFAILVPISLAPLITTLTWAEHRAKVLGKIPPPPPSSEPLGLGLGSSRIRGSVSRSRGRESLRAPSPNRGSRSRSRSRSTLHSLKSPLHHQTKFHSLLHKIWITAEKLDIVGLVLLGAGIACVLLPLTLSNNSNSRRGWGWGNPSLIGMLIAGIITLIVFAIYELRVAKRPVVAPRFWGNWAVLGAGVIGFFDFMSFYLSYTYLYSFIIVTKDWSLVDDIYFSNVQTVALTVFGILGGLLMRTTHRYKPILIAGLCIRTLGVGVMIHSRGAGGSTPELILTQILQGLGGGFAAVTSQVGAQASVMHGDVAMCTALVLLMTEIGGSVGSAVCTSSVLIQFIFFPSHCLSPSHPSFLCLFASSFSGSLAL
ncbi:MFS general substrate transporter [Sistotremastrum suecicum HHB10207 ss-3]|uniref:MFS general substrate transporter n=1 Tax=Sistotremastrum suecicum HHB10207 ss-3 TaxID=1314776 RepID=A0A166DIC0_9AGAM|nr:MFS general substrate transporter [Sistotremastrum suecicum HHB10207 ss-3]